MSTSTNSEFQAVAKAKSFDEYAEETLQLQKERELEHEKLLAGWIARVDKRAEEKEARLKALFSQPTVTSPFRR